jgi:hypothetical protein
VGFKSPKGAELTLRAAAFNTGGPFVQQLRPGTNASASTKSRRSSCSSTARPAPASVQANLWCAVEGLGERVPVRLLDGPDRAAVLKAQGWTRPLRPKTRLTTSRWPATAA